MSTIENHHEIIKAKCREYEEAFVEHADLIDNLEQYSRRNCALIHGIPETPDEKTDEVFISTVKQHLKVNLKARDLERSHRLGKPKQVVPIVQ